MSAIPTGSLAPDSPFEDRPGPARDLLAAEYREHHRRIRRRQRRTEQTGGLPAEVEQVMRGERHQPGRHERSDQTERDDRQRGLPEAAPADPHAAVEQDHDQRDDGNPLDVPNRECVGEARPEVGRTAAASRNNPAAGTRSRSLTLFDEQGDPKAPETSKTIAPKCNTSCIRGAYPPVWQTPCVPATVIVGAQWGDEGKGKIVDLLALDSDLVCRYQGGPNAGHTIVVGDETFKIRQIPSGVIRGKTCIIGAGCVVDPEVFLDEVDELESRGLSTRDVHVSGEAHLIMPWHVAIDQAIERRLGKLQIGTTKRGIGPCYADKAARLGIRVQDLLDAKILRQKIEVALAEKNVWLERVYGVRRSSSRRSQSNLEAYAQRLRPYVADTSLLVDRALRDGREVLLEGGQGTLLDLDHGTYPFVTSSNTVAANAATGVGIGPNRIDRVIGVAKAYVTRVGEGPFPTEIEGPDQQRIRQLGGEFGTVTGRSAAAAGSISSRSVTRSA